MNIKYAIDNQRTIYDSLLQSKKQNRLSHAYLFYGEHGTGKREMAYALACMMYCPNGGCMECEVCKSILENNHMNVSYIGIEDNKKMISKEQIMDLQDEFSKTSLVEGTRIYIVDGIDTASTAAQNSLLKFIEDPLNQTPTVGIFLATELGNVVSTIQSRCVLEHFNAIPLQKRVAELMASGAEELDAILAGSLTNDIAEALELLENKDFIKTKEAYLALLSQDNSRDMVMYYLNYQNYFSDSKRLGMLLEWIIYFLEDVNMVSNSNDNLILSPLYDKIILYKKKNEKQKMNKLEFVLDLFNKLKYNVSAKNIFHELIIKFI